MDLFLFFCASKRKIAVSKDLYITWSFLFYCIFYLLCLHKSCLYIFIPFCRGVFSIPKNISFPISQQLVLFFPHSFIYNPLLSLISLRGSFFQSFLVFLFLLFFDSISALALITFLHSYVFTSFAVSFFQKYVYSHLSHSLLQPFIYSQTLLRLQVNNKSSVLEFLQLLFHN